MARYIDVEPLEDKLKEHIRTTESELMLGALSTFLRVLDITPTADVAPVRHGRWEVVDAEPVVRCKDCKHRDPEDKKCDCGHTILWQLPRDDDWFCADGERRDDEID